jgi:hypothetical protein
MNEPRHYLLFLVTTTCRTCGEEYTFPELNMARAIPKGEAYSPPPLGGPVWDVPVQKKTVQRDVLFCTMCVDKVEKTPLPVQDNKRVLNVSCRNADGPVGEIDLKALGLI